VPVRQFHDVNVSTVSLLRSVDIERSLPDGNPPSGVASGYVWFDVMALLFAPMILSLVRSLSERNHGYTATEGTP
jgi:hypothetical protein